MREPRPSFLLPAIVALWLAGPVAAQELPRGELARLTLREALDRALLRNPSVQVAAAEVRRAAALVEQARAAAVPTLTGNGVYTRLDDDRKIGAQVFVAADQLAANVTLTVPLLAATGWARWAQAREGAQLAALQKGDVRRQVSIAVAHAYLQVLAQRRVLELNERARDTAQAHYDYAHKRFAQGLGSKLDEVRAEQELRGDEGQVESAHTALLRAQAALGVLLGAGRPVDAAGEPALPAPAGYESASAEAPRLRADLAALLVGQRAARRRLRDSFTDFLPSLSGVFMPMYQFPSTLVQPAWGWQAQLLLSVPFYDGGLRYGLLHERRALAEEAGANLLGALQQAQVDIEAGFAELRRAERALGGARRAAGLAHQAVDIALLSYRAGASTNLEVIDAQRRARDADTAAVRAEDDARQVRLDLLAASGRFP